MRDGYPILGPSEGYQANQDGKYPQISVGAYTLMRVGKRVIILSPAGDWVADYEGHEDFLEPLMSFLIYLGLDPDRSLVTQLLVGSTAGSSDG